MTKARMIQEMIDGAILTIPDMPHITAFFDIDDEAGQFFRYKNTQSGKLEELRIWSSNWIIQKPKKKRWMTRLEIFGILAKGGIVVLDWDGIEYLPGEVKTTEIADLTGHYKYATILEDGKLGLPQTFEVEE